MTITREVLELTSRQAKELAFQLKGTPIGDKLHTAADSVQHKDATENHIVIKIRNVPRERKYYNASSYSPQEKEQMQGGNY